MPSTTVTMPEIDPRDYQRFRKHLQPDGRLPPTYSGWLNDSLTVQKFHEAMGMKVRRVAVRWYEFLVFANRTGLPHTYELLTAYARTKGDPHGSESNAPEDNNPHPTGNGNGGRHEGLPTVPPALLRGRAHAFRLGVGR